jgi:hypothetical protein
VINLAWHPGHYSIRKLIQHREGGMKMIDLEQLERAIVILADCTDQGTVDDPRKLEGD